MFKLNTKRTYKQSVPLTLVDESGKDQKGTFSATFRVTPNNETRELLDDATLLDRVLVSVSDIEVPDDEGKPLEGEELLSAVKNDPAAAFALINAYQDSIIKKNRRRN